MADEKMTFPQFVTQMPDSLNDSLITSPAYAAYAAKIDSSNAGDDVYLSDIYKAKSDSIEKQMGRDLLAEHPTAHKVVKAYKGLEELYKLPYYYSKYHYELWEKDHARITGPIITGAAVAAWNARDKIKKAIEVEKFWEWAQDAIKDPKAAYEAAKDAKWVSKALQWGEKGVEVLGKGEEYIGTTIEESEIGGAIIETLEAAGLTIGALSGIDEAALLVAAIGGASYGLYQLAMDKPEPGKFDIDDAGNPVDWQGNWEEKNKEILEKINQSRASGTNSQVDLLEVQFPKGRILNDEGRIVNGLKTNNTKRIATDIANIDKTNSEISKGIVAMNSGPIEYNPNYIISKNDAIGMAKPILPGFGPAMKTTTPAITPRSASGTQGITNNIHIDNLIGKFEIHVNQLSDSYARIEEEVARVLLNATKIANT